MDNDDDGDGSHLIAPCGMNCGLCVAYQSQRYDLKKQGFWIKYCPGCIPRGENCLHMADSCEILRDGRVRFCFECTEFPCKRLQRLDKRYHTKYHMSMIENLRCIQEKGIETFLTEQAEMWRCERCGGETCCHYGLCLVCDLDFLRENRRYRWGEQDDE